MLLEIGLALLTKESVDDCIKVAQEAEKLSFSTIWLAEAYHYFRLGGGNWDARSSTSIAAAIGMATRRIKIGLAVVNPYTRHPALLAMEIATLDEITNGRLLVTLGSAKAGIVHLGFDSLQKTRPLQTFKESIQVIRGLISGNDMKFKGEIFSVDAPRLEGGRKYRADIPLYIGATGPRLLRLAGELSDGVITAAVTTPEWIRHAIVLAKEGAARSRRTIDASRFGVGGYLLCSVDEDGDRARDRARRMAATYLAGKVINIGETADKLLEKAGITKGEIEPIVQAIRQHDPTTAAELVDNKLLSRAFPLVGTPEECVHTLRRFSSAGMNMAILELVGDTNELVSNVQLIASKVLPEVA